MRRKAEGYRVKASSGEKSSLGRPSLARRALNPVSKNTKNRFVAKRAFNPR
ncbi:hypothetical protein A2U01_0035005 [Trifolium medium]|uniref:Uncharacterized protein n=1 Tax=Trifolium medium TaxID=97028 RepID=A0A392PP49_9FABA|nr:hypothetical protein [Trifolium medium]